MSEWQSSGGRGRFLFGVPSPDQVQHAAEAQARALEALIREEEAHGYQADDEALFGASIGVEESFPYAVWWFDAPRCDGSASCACGRSSLLDAVSHMDSRDRAVALSLHTKAMRGLYDHFWSGQGLLEGGASQIGDACAACITVGANHVWDVFDAASEMAEELGETISAFSATIDLGEPRYDA